MQQEATSSFLTRCFVLTSLIFLASIQPCYGQTSGGSARIAARPPAPLFHGLQGKQRTEIHFDPNTNTVNLKMLVQDQNGFFIPDLHSDNFAVYENGVRQQASVSVEHAPVTIMLLIEHGGRTPALERLLDIDIRSTARQLVALLGKGDRVQVSAYNDAIRTLTGFTEDMSQAEEAIDSMSPPPSSEIDLYDTIIAATKGMSSIQGRKAIVLISTGINTFSKASYDDVRSAVRSSDTPIYVISMAKRFHDVAELEEPSGPATHIDWRTAERHLEEIGRESGARTYSAEDTTNLSAIYDDLLENLRVRYVISYRSSSHEPPDVPRQVRIELVDPRTGGPLRIVDSNGRAVPFRLFYRATYVPAAFARPGTQP